MRSSLRHRLARLEACASTPVEEDPNELVESIPDSNAARARAKIEAIMRETEVRDREGRELSEAEVAEIEEEIFAGLMNPRMVSRWQTQPCPPEIRAILLARSEEAQRIIQRQCEAWKAAKTEAAL